MKILIFTLLISLNTFAAELKTKLPEIGHLVKTYCLNGTQYYYHREDRSGSLSPAVINGKFVECEKNNQQCKKSVWDGSIVCQ